MNPHFGKAISLLRVVRGLRAVDVARGIHIHPGYLSQFENREKAPSKPVSAKLCKLYRVSPEDLYRIAADPAGELGIDP